MKPIKTERHTRSVWNCGIVINHGANLSLGARAVIHSHSKHCVMATLLFPGNEFRISHQEMIKGMKKGQTGVNYRWVLGEDLDRHSIIL